MVPQQEMVHEFLENSAKKKMRWRMIKENVHSGRQKKKKIQYSHKNRNITCRKPNIETD
jgi:hypothetical protein